MVAMNIQGKKASSTPSVVPSDNSLNTLMENQYNYIFNEKQIAHNESGKSWGALLIHLLIVWLTRALRDFDSVDSFGTKLFIRYHRISFARERILRVHKFGNWHSTFEMEESKWSSIQSNLDHEELEYFSSFTPKGRWSIVYTMKLSIQSYSDYLIIPSGRSC